MNSTFGTGCALACQLCQGWQGSLASALTVLWYDSSDRGRRSGWHLRQQRGDPQAVSGKAGPAATSGQAAAGQQPAAPAHERAALSQSAGSVNGRQSSFNDALYGSHPSATGGALQTAGWALLVTLCSLPGFKPGGMPARQVGPRQVTVAAQGIDRASICLQLFDARQPAPSAACQ